MTGRSASISSAPLASPAVIEFVDGRILVFMCARLCLFYFPLCNDTSYERASRHLTVCQAELNSTVTGHGLVHHFDLLPLTVKAVQRIPFCSLCCVPDNFFPSLLNCQSVRDVTIAP